jgi:hypothetical protein
MMRCKTDMEYVSISNDTNKGLYIATDNHFVKKYKCFVGQWEDMSLCAKERGVQTSHFLTNCIFSTFGEEVLPSLGTSNTDLVRRALLR